jgi:carboxylesterase type B
MCQDRLGTNIGRAEDERRFAQVKLVNQGRVAPVPLLIGSNKDEGTGFMGNDSSMTYALPLNISGE